MKKLFYLIGQEQCSFLSKQCKVCTFSKLKKCLYILPVGFSNSTDQCSIVPMNVP